MFPRNDRENVRNAPYEQRTFVRHQLPLGYGRLRAARIHFRRHTRGPRDSVQLLEGQKRAPAELDGNTQASNCMQHPGRGRWSTRGQRQRGTQDSSESALRWCGPGGFPRARAHAAVALPHGHSAEVRRCHFILVFSSLWGTAG